MHYSYVNRAFNFLFNYFEGNTGSRCSSHSYCISWHILWPRRSITYTRLYRLVICCLPVVWNRRPPKFSQFNGAVSYTLIPFCLRLVGCITATHPKLDIELLGYCIFKKDFHLLHYATSTVAPHHIIQNQNRELLTKFSSVFIHSVIYITLCFFG